MSERLITSELIVDLEKVAKSTGKLPKQLSEATNPLDDALGYFAKRNTVAYHSDGFASEISDHLRHITVNPNNDFLSAMIKSSYVFSNQVNLDDGDFAVNSSEASVRKFTLDLIESAKRELALSLEPSDRLKAKAPTMNCVHLLHGDRGIGKTFFLNYLLTSQEELLTFNKTIWVRLNFVYASGYEDNLVAWMHAQAAKIALRYYDQSSEHKGPRCIDVLGLLTAWIEDPNEKFSELQKGEYKHSIQLMKTAFGKLGRDRSISKTLCNEVVCENIYYLLRSQGWSFVFVLDGFDQLDVSPDQIGKFERLKTSILAFISMRSNFGAAVLIVSRSNTLEDLRATDPFRVVPSERRFRISAPDLRSIVTKRFEAIQHVALSYGSGPEIIGGDKVRNLLRDFAQYIDQHVEFYSVGDRHSAQNVRSRMQILYLLFLDFVDEKTGKTYLLVEHMMLNSHRYPVVAYSYSFGSGGKLVAQPTDEMTHESRFLPIVSRVCPLSTNPSTAVAGGLGRVLTSIRILQVCLAASAIADRQQIPTIDEIADLLKCVFSYERQEILMCVRELAAFDVLRIQVRPGFHVDSGENWLSALPKSKYLLKECLHNVAYLNMCAMRTLLPRQIFNSGLIALGTVEAGENGLAEWVHRKVTNSVFLFSFLLKLSTIERSQCSGKQHESLTVRQRNILSASQKYSNLWDLFESLVPGFAVEVSRVLESTSRLSMSLDQKLLIINQVRRSVHMFQ
jgi:hypothetical protein